MGWQDGHAQVRYTAQEKEEIVRYRTRSVLPTDQKNDHEIGDENESETSEFFFFFGSVKKNVNLRKSTSECNFSVPVAWIRIAYCVEDKVKV